MKRLFSVYFILFLLCSSFFGIKKADAAPPANFQTTQIIGSGLDGPSAFEFAPDNRIFILQRTGEIKVYKNNALLASNFAVLPSIASGDRGLIGVAFDPSYATNHFAYFYYTGLDKLNHLVRFDASGDTGTSQTELYHTNSPSEQLHVGGTIRFGPDGKMYFAVGDNGYGPNAQDLSNPHGKIMRLNKDGTIPTDNPFYGQAGKLGEIWAYGLRNPWRFQFDSVSGDLYDGDVGADSWEEINRIVKGGNYGWPNCEGKCNPTNLAYIDPIYTYPHVTNGIFQSSAVTQGPVYHGSMFPSDYQNNIFYGDYARGTIRRLTLDSGGAVNGNFDFDIFSGSVVDMKTASDGSMYYITYYPGRMYRISYSTTSHIPVANSSADNVKGTNPLTVHFSSAGSYDPDNTPIAYSWNFGDGTTSSDVNPTKIYTKDGTYTVELTVSDGTNVAQSRPIVIQVGCPPKVTVGNPKDGSFYKSGDSITVNASAIDCAGFDINDASLSTTVKFHHTTHIHPFLDNLPGRVNTFSVPTIGEPSADTWFEIDVTATDTSGLSTTAVTNIYPIKSNLTFATAPVGLQILLDGQPMVTPQTIQGVVGFVREVNVSNAQQLNGVCYNFDHWSDLGTQKHTLSTSTVDTTYTASFKQVTCQSDLPLKYTIYDDALGADWADWSWSSSVEFSSANAYSGTSAIAWTSTAPWAGFFVHRREFAFDTTGYDSITFALKATQANQPVEVQLYDEFDKVIGTPVNVSAYGGDPVPGAYKVYNIPLTALGGVNKKIGDLHLQNVTDSPQPAMYIDLLGLTGSGSVTPPPSPTVGANLLANSSFENTGTTWLSPWKFDVWGTAAGTVTQDTTNKSAGTASSKATVTKANATAPYQTQLYQTGLPIDQTKTYTVSFSAKASAGRNIDVVLQQFGTPYTVYWTKTVDLTTTWQRFTYIVALNSSNPSSFLGFNLAAKTGTVWIDEVSFCQGTCSIMPPPPPANVYKFYDESLTTGWENWSWDSTINFSNTNTFYSGTKSISYLSNAAWSGLSLHNNAGVDTAGYTTFHFALRATQAGQKYAVFLKDINGVSLTAPLSLANYGGDPVATGWKVYDIPLSTLNAGGKKISEVSLHDFSGTASPAVYVDEIQLK